MNCLTSVFYIYILLHLTIGWQVPSAKFLLDLEIIYNWKSIIIYLPDNSEKWIADWKYEILLHFAKTIFSKFHVSD